ncbi:MAG: hypothetical protein ACI9JN_000571 [Bacteroidia bacterium]|jgi:hypothetical protein
MKNLLIILICFVGVQSCKQSTDDDVSIELDCQKAEIYVHQRFEDLSNDFFELKDYTIIGNTLRLDIKMSGCNFQRNYRLIIDEAISKSLPPQQNAKLTFNQQSCSAIFEFQICFDISNIPRPTDLKLPPATAGIKTIHIN